MDEVKKLLQDWVDEGLLPGAALRVIRDGRVWYACEAGTTSITKEQAVTPDTLFDLASLTKVTATLPASLLLMQEAQVSPDDPIGRFFSDCPTDKGAITIAQLLTHTSGLPADLAQRRRDDILSLPSLIYQQPLIHKPGTRVVYSDLGMIWLGLLIEKLTGERLDAFVERRIFRPLQMHHTFYRPNKKFFQNISSTEFSSLLGGYIVGEVHDEKAYAMGGIAGHAGLFSTADDLAKYAMCWLYDDQQIVSSAWRRRAIQCHTSGLGGSRGYGWDLRGADTASSCGQGFYPDSFGHTGFTGTSMWIDPIQEWAVIFLTNAVHLGRDHQLRRLRPILHDAVTAHLQKSLT